MVVISSISELLSEVGLDGTVTGLRGLGFRGLLLNKKN